MKKKIRIISFIIIISISLIILLNENNNLITIGKVQTAQAEQTEDLEVKYKTTNSIVISWENIVIPDTVVKFNVYKDGQLITTITDKSYIYASLTSGIAYNFKVDFLTQDDIIVMTKLIDNIMPAKTISSFNQNMTLEKDTYYINSITIPQGITINVSAGSILKIYSGATLTINGIFKLNGTDLEKVTFTSIADIGNGCDPNNYWKQIQINSTGVFEAKNAIIKYGGRSSDWYLYSSGIINFENTKISDLRSSYGSSLNSGNVRIINSNIEQTNNFNNLTSIDIQSNSLYEIKIIYDNSIQENYTNILNSSITRGITYTPNMYSTSTIQNNVTTGGAGSALRIYLANANKNIIKDVSNNTNSEIPQYGEIEILSMPIVPDMIFPKSIYHLYNMTIPQGITISIPAGSIMKMDPGSSLTINGALKLNGTDTEKVIFTSTIDMGAGCPADRYWQKVQVNSTGLFETNNAIIRYGGSNTSWYLDSYGAISFENTQVSDLRSSGSSLNSGSVKIINSSIENTNNFTNLTNIDIQNSSLYEIIMTYNNSIQDNVTNILSNSITRGITYTPNMYSSSTIQNNVTTGAASSVLRIYLANANKNIIKDVSNNTSIQAFQYGEIKILSVPTVPDMIFPKSVYYIDNMIIPEGITINIPAGSMLKIGDSRKLTINGTLKLNGTEEKKVIITSIRDIGFGAVYYFDQIQVGYTGNFEATNAIIRYGGTYSYKYLDSYGTVKFKNTEINNTYDGATFNSGSVEIIDSNIEKLINFNNLANVNIQNSLLFEARIVYNNQIQGNDINILSNTITNGIKFTPNMLSQPTIKDNISTSSYYPVNFICTNSNANIFKNISNNKNFNNVYYENINISGIVNNLKLTNNNYYMLENINIPIDKLLEIESGTNCRLEQYSLITVDGKLVINGNNQNNVTLTNKKDSTSSRNYRGIKINSTGVALINNMTMRYCGYSGYPSSPAIQNNGKLYLINSSITNIQSSNALVYSTSFTDQVIKYNYIGGSVTSNLVVDGTNNYWGATNGPRRYNPVTKAYDGSGSSIDTNILWDPYYTTFIKSDYVLDPYINDTFKLERQHFGEAGINGYTGNYSKTYDDLNIVIPNIDLKFSRTYNSKNTSSDILGRGWTFGFSSKVEVNLLDSNVVYVYLPDGSINIFTKQIDGTFLAKDARNKLTMENGIYVLTTKEQTKYFFNDNNYLYKITDKYGNITNITIDSIGKITNITDYTGRVYTISYINNKVSQITDPMNRSIIYNYNTQGLLYEVIGLNGKSTYYEYDSNGYMTYVKENNDLNQIITTQSMTYVSDSVSGYRVSTIKDESGKIDTYSYNQTEKSTTITDQNSRVTKKYFDATGYTTKIVEPNNLETLITYDIIDSVNKYGDVKSRTEVTGQTTTYDRDSNGNVIKQTNSDSSYKTYEYNLENSLTKETDETGNITQYVYSIDGVTLLKKILSNNAEVNFEYYPTGIKGLISKKTDELGKFATYEYDNHGNLTKTTNTLGNYETYTYNNLDWLLNKTTCEGYTSTYEYDNVGNNTKITENNKDTINEYNYKNNLTKTIDANNNTITNEYDNAQNVVKKTDQEGNITLYEYDIYKNVTKETKSNGALYTYTYDTLNRNIKTSIMLNNVETTLQEKEYSYNSGNKTVTTKQYSTATDYTTNVQISNYLDKVTNDTTELATKTTIYLNNGLASVEQNEIGKHVYYYYNSLNKITKKYEEIDTNKYKITNYTYDAAGNVTKEETSQEKVLLDAVPTSYITTNNTYDDIGNIVLKTTSSGEEFKYTYDKDNNIIKEEIKIEDGKYKTIDYTYNYAKKVTSKKEYVEKRSLVTNSIDDTTITTLDTLYEYDSMNNLTKETSPDGTITNHYYDKLNRETKNEIIKDDKTITQTATYLFDTKDKVLSKADVNGNVATYEYDIFENFVKETKPNNTITSYENNFFGNPTKEILPNNVENTQNNITYTYDKYGNVITKTKNYMEDATQKQITTTYEYDLLGNLINETTANVSKSSTYNKAGKAITKTDENGNTTTYVYDAKLNVVKETNEKGTVIDYYFDKRNNLVKKEIDNVIQEENTYNLVNNKITEKDELGLIITNTYDLNSNLVKQVNNINGYTVRNQYTISKKIARSIDNYDKELLYKYDILNNVIEETEKQSDETQIITTKTKYDNLSNKTETTDGNGNITTYEYDGNNNLIKETNPKGQATTYTYDKNGNKLTETDYLNNTLINTYDNLDRVTEKLDQYNNRIEKLVYDNLGRQIKSIDANDNIIEYTFDNNNNTLTKKDQELNTETYEYDSNNNKTKYVDKNNNITNYEYNNKNKLTKVINALNESTIYTYDNKGNMLTQKDAANNVIEYVYDINSNEIKKIDQLGNEDSKTYYPNGKQETFTTNNGDVFTYTYDIHGRLVNENIGQENTTYEYDNNDNKTKIGNILKTYDNLNRVLTKTENSQTVTYTYDDALKTTTITDPKNNVTVEEYDKANRLLKVTNNSKVTEYVYNIDGSVQKQINPTTTSTYEYYPDKKIKRLTTKDVNDILIEGNYYEYDSNNNITLENAKVYTYDALNRIKTNDGTEYTYDLAGNILSKSILEGVNLKVTTYVYNNKNQLLSTATLENTTLISESTYTYDDNGNQLTEITNNVTTTNTYNARNELTNVDNGQTLSQYSYNAEGKRLQKTVDNVTTNFVYDGDNIILELDDTNNQVATNTYGLALLKRTTNEEGYYLYNGHGDVTKILDDTNTVLNTYVYDSFGKILSETETFNNPFKYAGYYYDKETKTYYLQARYYNPEIQRFISEDTYRGELDDPLSLNLYTYVRNNPMIYTDSNGHFWKEIGDIFKYIGKRAVAAVHAGAELAFDSVKGTAGLAWNLGETLGSEIGFIGNEIGHGFKLMKEEQYLNNKTKYLNTISNNMNMYAQMPGSMLKGIGNNFGQTFNWDNFKNYWNPNTSYTELKDYSKSAIQTGLTIYGGVKIVQAAYNKISQVYNGIQVDKFIKNNVPIDNQINIKKAFGSDAKVTILKNDTTVYRYHDGASVSGGNWYTPNQTNTPITDLALPESNPATYVNTYSIQKGTTIIKGTVAPNFGQSGGGIQFYVPNPSIVIPIK